MRPFAVVAASALVVGACSSGGGDDGAEREPTTTTAEPTTTTTTLPDTESLTDASVTLTEIATLDQPVAMASRPGDDDTIYVAERPGRVRAIDLAEGGAQVRPEPVADVSERVMAPGGQDERGLLGLAFSPDGDFLYVHYSDRATEGDTAVEELPADPGSGVNATGVIYTLEQPFPNHNGGQLAFGPDGFLYIGLGDGGGAGDTQGEGQNTNGPLGSVLRIDPSGDESPYTVPPDNPFGDGSGAPEIWLYGVRNPWRFSFDAQTGDLWLADVGQGDVEEIDFLPAENGEGAGREANLGWNLMEGSREFTGPPPPDHVAPILEYGHEAGGCAVIGGYVYRGEAIPSLRGAYLYGDLCLAQVEALLARDGEVVEQRGLGVGVEGRTMTSFGEGPDRELYVLSLAGPVLRLEPA